MRTKDRDIQIEISNIIQVHRKNLPNLSDFDSCHISMETALPTLLNIQQSYNLTVVRITILTSTIV